MRSHKSVGGAKEVTVLDGVCCRARSVSGACAVAGFGSAFVAAMVVGVRTDAITGAVTAVVFCAVVGSGGFKLRLGCSAIPSCALAVAGIASRTLGGAASGVLEQPVSHNRAARQKTLKNVI